MAAATRQRRCGHRRCSRRRGTAGQTVRVGVLVGHRRAVGRRPEDPARAAARTAREYLARRTAFKSNYKSEADSFEAVRVDAKRRLLEQAIVSLIEAPGIERSAADYVTARTDSLRVERAARRPARGSESGRGPARRRIRARRSRRGSPPSSPSASASSSRPGGAEERGRHEGGGEEVPDSTSSGHARPPIRSSRC